MSDFSGEIARYQKELSDLIIGVQTKNIQLLIEELIKSYEIGARVYIFGNGGSGATASHMAQDWNKGTKLCLARENGRRLKVICLNNNVPEMLAYGNDVGFEDIFLGQLDTHLDAQDLVIPISGSGNSKNIVKAVEYANVRGARTFGLCGAYNKSNLLDGGLLQSQAKNSLHVRSADMQHIEDVHHAMCHLALQAICEYLKQPISRCVSQETPANKQR